MHWGREGERGNGALPTGETRLQHGSMCKELAGWLPSGPWLLPTVRLLQTVVGSARLEENDFNFFLFGFISLVYFVFSPFGGYSEWAGPLGETQLPLLASF